MDSIFSDDEEFDALREQLYDGSVEDENEKMVPLFGMYAIHKTNGKEKPRHDIFLRGMETPTNDVDPYANGSFQKSKPSEVKKSTLGDNFSFFGMKQGRMRIEENTPSSDYGAERQRLLKKLEQMKEEENQSSDADYCSEEENEEPKTPKYKPMQTRKTNIDTPRPKMELRKRKREIVISSSEEESDSGTDAPHSSFTRSPRRKRVSPA